MGECPFSKASLTPVCCSYWWKAKDWGISQTWRKGGGNTPSLLPFCIQGRSRKLWPHQAQPRFHNDGTVARTALAGTPPSLSSDHLWFFKPFCCCSFFQCSSHVLIHSPNTYSSCSWAMPNLGAGNLIQVSSVGGRDPTTELMNWNKLALPDTVKELEWRAELWCQPQVLCCGLWPLAASSLPAC